MVGILSGIIVSRVRRAKEAAMLDNAPLAAYFIEPETMKSLCSENRVPYRRLGNELIVDGVPVLELEVLPPDFHFRNPRPKRPF